MGFHVTVVGCRFKNSPKLKVRDYQVRRIRLFFKKSFLFYAEYNFKLFFYLLFHQMEVLTANDLDSLLPNIIVAKLRKKKLVYDSHEYFCQMLSIIHRPFVQHFWHQIERYCIPKVQYAITVSQSIADAYHKEYGIHFNVVRNIPPAHAVTITETRHSLGLPEDKFIVLMQGNDISSNRGSEELLEAIPYVSEKAILLFVGNGETVPYLKLRTKELNLEERVIFVGRVTPDRLFNYTSLSDVGVSLEKSTSLNQAYSLPNKIFEYIKAGIPLLISNLPERAAIISQYNIGEIAQDFTPKNIANLLNKMIDNPILCQQFKANCSTAANELNWENEEKVVKSVYENLLS
jgi:glycosyltransferase involved in cell wall biosynthesis